MAADLVDEQPVRLGGQRGLELRARPGEDPRVEDERPDLRQRGSWRTRRLGVRQRALAEARDLKTPRVTARVSTVTRVHTTHRQRVLL